MIALSNKSLLSGLALLSCSAALSNAALLFSDNYDVTGPSWGPGGAGIGPNYDAANPGRQGGSAATPTLGYVFSGNVQVGNTTTLAPAPGSDVGDEMLMAFGGMSVIDHNFGSAGTPLEISFNGLANFNNPDPTVWFSFTLGDSTDGRFVNDSSLDFGILFRQNGGTQYFMNGGGTTGISGSSVPLNTWSNYKIVLSDTAGTGSAFASGGSRVDYYQNGTLLGTALLDHQLTPDQGYIGFGSEGGNIVGIDTVGVTSVPEPSSMMALGSLAGLALFRRRK